MTRRIALAILATCWLVLLLGGGASFFAIRHALLKELDASLVLRASSLPEVLGVADRATQTTLPPDDRYVIRNSRGQTLTRPGEALPVQRHPVLRSAQFATLGDGTRVRSVTVVFPAAAPAGGPGEGPDFGELSRAAEMTVVYSRSAESFDRLIERLALILGVVGLVAGVVTAGVAVGVARSALRPLNAAAGTIASIHDAVLDRRVEVSDLPEELRPMVERLNQMLARLEQGFGQRKQFMADAAHELRTPVASLMTSIDVTLRHPRDVPALTRTLQDCAGDVRVLRRLVEGLLEQYRSEATAPLTQCAEVDVAAVLDGCVEATASLARQRGVVVKHDYRSDLRAVTHARRLRSIAANLLDNAVEHSPAGSSVELVCDVSVDELTLTVRDHGPGISAQVLPRLFEPFVRGDARTESGHCGLGLYLVKSHVDALGGTCAVRSTLGSGTELRITLPNHGGSMQLRAAAIAEPAPAAEKASHDVLIAASCGTGQDADASARL